MITVNVVYYKSELGWKLEMDRASRKGKDVDIADIPKRRRTVLDVRLPYLPRPGDRLFIEDRVDRYGETVSLQGIEVKFIEMIDGEESVYVHTTDPGCEAFGRISDEAKKEIEDFTGYPVKL